MVLALVAGAAPGGAAPTPRPEADPSPLGEVLPGPALRLATGGDRQTSDGQPGLVTTDGRLGGMVRDSHRTSWKVARGVRYTQWRRQDARGRLRIHLLTVRLDKSRVQVRPVSAGKVPRRGPLTKLLRREKAVAGVNGDFFDIADTGAPLGVLSSRGKVRHGATIGWPNALYRAGGRWRTGPLPLRAGVIGHPDVPITNLNSPWVAPGGIGAYTKAWGTRPGRQVTGETGPVRVVRISNGRVVSNETRLGRGEPIQGTLLVGREEGAALLKSALPVGTAAGVSTWLDGRPGFAIGGDRPLLVDGEHRTVDDTVMHPRTAVGVNRSGRRMFLLVVDGRSSRSRGLTMVETADLMIELGAYQALNLDGGGSSTMVAPNRKRRRTDVRNTPSDGRERWIPNGVGIFVRAKR